MSETQTESSSGGMPKNPPLTLGQLLDTPAGVDVNVAIDIRRVEDGLLAGPLIEPDEDEPFNRYHRSRHEMRVRWTDATKVVMGGRDGLTVGAPVWVTGILRNDDDIDARLLALLGDVAEVDG